MILPQKTKENIQRENNFLIFPTRAMPKIMEKGPSKEETETLPDRGRVMDPFEYQPLPRFS